MGFFNKAFRGKSDYPELDADSPVMDQLHAIEQPLRELMAMISDPLEVVPAEGRTYVFVGKPPKRFGIAWIENGQLVNFQVQAKEMGINPNDLQSTIAKLGTAYEHDTNTQRYSTTIAGRTITVTPSRPLNMEVQEIVASIMN